MNKDTILYRKRLLPEECVLLKDDIIIYADEKYIITEWKALHPKPDLHHGYSCYCLKEGFKVSQFYSEDNRLLYWYCDIVSYDYNETENTLLVTDLLADVVIYPDGFVKVVDIDELAICLENGRLSEEMLKKSLITLNSLLQIIYSGEFDSYKKMLEEHQ